jgi:hypothetical protein
MSANTTFTPTRFDTAAKAKLQKKSKSIWRQIFDAWLYSYSMRMDACGNVIGEI